MFALGYLIEIHATDAKNRLTNFNGGSYSYLYMAWGIF